ncbi:MAG: UDP-N-acetylglucosamine 4,6-dehydratase (inverting) [Acidimicrobiales bacterium]|nr:UDP-N-acetylglucosamine 4,6-dehydratase (inverting) [Acidimicrobiales bacterium]MCB9372585.1 UDP-N-acetylglucosamine 4,6-dehydratase (inverting) [Microthrixaceae bacterium]
MDLSGATILLTGGTGSFGNAFVERVLGRWPDATIRVYSRDELKQSEMLARHGDRNVRYLLGDVRNKTRLARACQGADVIVHAAAMKQVPACEYNPFEAVQTNVLGTQHVVDCAIDSSVTKVVALSTDKAVNPVNLYGATKLCEEKIVVQGNAYASHSDTVLSCVRYGNVVGSRGSVVPLFQRQAEAGLLTVTDERMTRFWITLDQAVDLVLFALDHAAGGEVFIPKIPSMKVTDLAEAIAPGVPREVTGIRPGEKLHELLLTADESRHSVETEDVYVVLPEHPWWTDEPRWLEGKPLDDDFTYSSATNTDWLSVEDLRELVG